MSVTSTGADRACCDALIVGGGLAGLSCAVALADVGTRSIVLEGSDMLGGRARSWRHAPSGDVVDIGPHVVNSEYANFLAFLQRLGTRERIVWQPQPVITLATTPAFRLHRYRLPPPFGLFPDMLRAPGLSLRDIAHNMRAAMHALQYDESQRDAFDAITGLQWLQSSGVTPAMIDWYWRLAALSTLNVPLERCSAASLMRVQAQISGHRGFHFGFAQLGLGELYVDQSVRVIENAGGRVVTHARVTRVARETDTWSATTDDARRFFARHLIYALPPGELAALDSTLAPSRRMEPSPYKSLYLWFDRPVTTERFWALLVARDRLNCDFYDLSRIRPALRGGPSLIASNMVYSHAAERLSESTLIERTLNEIAIFAPAVRAARLLHADVHHIPMAVPCAVPGFERARPTTRTRRDNVYLAGDWTDTGLPCSMESAVRSGFLAADAVLANDGKPPTFAIKPRPYDAIAGWIHRRARGR